MTQNASGPLAGLRVVELAGLGPGPFAAMLLADLGADVIRVDRPGGGGLASLDATRDFLNRGRPNVALNLKSEKGRETLLELIDKADVLIEGFRPGVTERLGFGPDVCLERNPKLVYARMTGWGQSGPLADKAGHDVNYIGVAGGLGPIGRAGGAPQVPLNLLGDFAGGSMYLATGVLAALHHVRATGQGQVVDAAIVDGTAHLMTMIHGLAAMGQWSNKRGTNLLDTGVPFYDVYETSDGKWMTVGGLEPQFWAETERILAEHGFADLPDRNDPKNFAALRERLTEIFAAKTRDEWTAIFENTDSCVQPCLEIDEAATHPHMVAREVFVEHEGVVQPAPAPRFSATPATLGLPPRGAGADTREALTAWGIEDVDGLIAEGAAVEAMS